MPKKVVILAPRLDVTFKDFGDQVPESWNYDNLPPIRKHWLNCIVHIKDAHLIRGDDVFTSTLPLWQFTPEMVQELKLKNDDGSKGTADIVYVPHREKHNFTIEGDFDVRYYMQSVFPHLFYIDSKGFAGGSSMYPFPLNDTPFILNGPGPFEALRAHGLGGNSKFDQPPMDTSWDRDGYILFTCQIPHDQTIMYHSDVSVAEALETTLKDNPCTTVIVKGHPVNRASMEPLKAVAAKYPNAIWVDDKNINDLIRGSKLVVTVNSGTGMEALLHKKPVYVFGRCEYDCVASRTMQNPEFNELRVRKFFNQWMERMYNTRNLEDFFKLP